MIIQGGDYGLVIKEAANASITLSTIVGGSVCCIDLKAADTCSVTQCTLSNDAAVVVLVQVNPGTGNKTHDCILTNNSIAATSTADVFDWGDSADDSGGSVCDYNAYDISATSGNVGSVYGTSGITTLVGLQAAWDTYDVTTNDDHSTLTT